MLTDTLAGHSIGGFKMVVGFALRICRDCLATKEMIQHKLTFACNFDIIFWV